MKTPDENDWRLEIAGSEAFRGAVFEWRRWAPHEAVTWSVDSDKPEPSIWDHEHCHFCGARFCDHEEHPENLHEGYRASDPHLLSDKKETSEDGRTLAKRFQGRVQEPLEPEIWVCPTCFEDFLEYYGWEVGKPGL